jgi:hypothetical protein
VRPSDGPALPARASVHVHIEMCFAWSPGQWERHNPNVLIASIGRTYAALYLYGMRLGPELGAAIHRRPREGA